MLKGWEEFRRELLEVEAFMLEGGGVGNARNAVLVVFGKLVMHGVSVRDGNELAIAVVDFEYVLVLS